MKVRYPVIGIIFLFISATIWENVLGTETYNRIGHPIMVILLLSLLGLIIYLIVKVISNELFDLTDDIQRHYEHKERRKEQQAYIMDNINQELDEIEATLDAISEAENSDGKITPIWNSKPPKR